MSSKNYSETPAYRVLVEHSPRQSEDLYLTLCGIEQCRPDKERESRVRDSFHLHVVLSGNGTLEAEGYSAHLREGQLFLIKPGEKITYYPDPQNPWVYCWMSFDGAQADALMREAGFGEGVYALESHVHVSKFYQLCNAALETPQMTHAGALRRFGLMLQFIAAAIESNDWECGSRKLKDHRPLQNKQDYTRYAIDYIKNNYSSITLRDVSDYLGINYNYFSAVFKQSQGISPNEYLLRVRMRQSSQMLANLTLDIQHIANYVGYSDSLTFSKAFKRFFGVSPKFYREMPVEERPIFDTIIANRSHDRQEYTDMAIQYDAGNRTITLQTRETTYQMQISGTGHVLHLYYGRRIDGACLDYPLVLTDCGFSPNSYENRLRREVSPDILPLEYSAAASGDYRVSALECVSDAGVVGADLRYVRHEITGGKYRLPGLPAAFADREDAQTLSLALADAVTGLEVELLYGVFEAADMITRAAIFRNRGDAAIRLDRAASLCLDIPFGGEWDLLHFHGRHCMERMPERTRLMHGIQTVGSRRGASSHHHNPFVVLMASDAGETSGTCIGVMPVYSGNHRTDVELDQANAVRVVSGIGGDLFGWRLEPGERFVAPEVILCHTDAGLESLTHHYHNFLNRHLIRSPWKDRRRPLLINSWESMTCDFDADRVLKFAAEAAKLGVGMVVLDDGWFGARDDDNAGLGDWFANEGKLPGGLKPLSDAIHAMGMKFGLWIEPEMVNEDSDLYRAHPDWALTVPGRKPAMGRNQLVLDMGNRVVVEHLYGVFSALIRDNGIDYIKWDMNRNIADTWSAALPPHRQTEVSHRYMLGVYELMDRLTGEFPEVLFENCAGGGGRFDAGMLYYTPQIWCSDDSDAIERLTIQMGTAVGYPVGAMGAHVSACPNQQTGRTAPFGTRAIVAMSGTFGYELDPARLSDAEKRQMRVLAERYDRFYDLIRRGSYYRLTGIAQAEDHVAWAFVGEGGRQALVNLVVTRTHANTHGIHFRLRGLNPGARYRLAEMVLEGCEQPDGAYLCGQEMTGRVFTGASLMYAGFTLRPMRGDYPGVQLLFEQADAEER